MSDAPPVRRAGHEYSRPGNYYIMEGTWVRRPQSSYKELGVVASIEPHGPDSPRDGSITILWFPNGSEHLSAQLFFRKLREGRLVVDERQHPYDKNGWEHASIGSVAELPGGDLA